MAYSFYVDDFYNDFRITNGEMVLVQGCDNVAQQIRITLRTQLGEWYLKTTFGLPYYSTTGDVNDNTTRGIFGGNIAAAEIEDHLLLAVFQVPGVISVNSFELSQVTSRKFIVNMEVLVESSNVNGLGTQEEVSISLDLGD